MQFLESSFMRSGIRQLPVLSNGMIKVPLERFSNFSRPIQQSRNPPVRTVSFDKMQQIARNNFDRNINQILSQEFEKPSARIVSFDKMQKIASDNFDRRINEILSEEF